MRHAKLGPQKPSPRSLKMTFSSSTETVFPSRGLSPSMPSFCRLLSGFKQQASLSVLKGPCIGEEPGLQRPGPRRPRTAPPLCVCKCNTCERVRMCSEVCAAVHLACTQSCYQLVLREGQEAFWRAKLLVSNAKGVAVTQGQLQISSLRSSIIEDLGCIGEQATSWDRC